jgi:hypothetical protein
MQAGIKGEGAELPSRALNYLEYRHFAEHHIELYLSSTRAQACSLDSGGSGLFCW